MNPSRFSQVALWFAAVTGIATLGASAASSLTVGRAVGQPGAPAAVSVSLNSDVGVVAAQFDLAFNVAVAEGLDAVVGTAANRHHAISTEIAPGSRRVVLYSLQNEPLGNGPIADIRLNVLPGLPEQIVPLTLTNVVLAKADSTASAPVNVIPGTLTVSTALPTRFSAINRLPTGQVVLQATGTTGRRYILQSSPDLQTWSSLATNTANDGVLDYTDATAPVGRRYYRTLLEP